MNRDQKNNTGQYNTMQDSAVQYSTVWDRTSPFIKVVSG